jgi:hypothetical protein
MELPAGLVGAGEGVGLGVCAKAERLKQPMTVVMRRRDSNDSLILIVRMIAP